MSWDQLDAIRESNRRSAEAEIDLADDPWFCPLCLERLSVNDVDERDCPYGHYRWP